MAQEKKMIQTTTEQETCSPEKQECIQQLIECLRLIRSSLVKQQKAYAQERRARIQQLIECLRLIRISLVETLCRGHNFIQGLNKNSSLNLSEIIPIIYKQELRSETLQDAVSKAISEAFAHSKAPEVLFELLLYLADNSDLLKETTYIQGIMALANHHKSWLRSPEAWCFNEDNQDQQFSDLARHLFADYQVPYFMDRVWFRGNETHQNWFIHIGAGRNIRTAAGLPLTLTKKMAHHFLTAPEDFTLEEAFRWGQVHAFGGDERLANALRGTKLTQSEHDFWSFTDLLTHQDFWGDNDHFWLNVIRFFIANPMLDISRHVGPIIDYIWDEKYGERDKTGHITPNQPDFGMKGRNPEVLLRRVAEWHQALGERIENEEELEWPRSQIGEFSFQEEGTEKQNMNWHIRELLSSKELIEEGRTMSHCVATYIGSCHSRFTSIWSMETEKPKGQQKVLTIQVSLYQKRVDEVRGEKNRLPTPEEKSILKKWADKEGLQLPKYI